MNRVVDALMALQHTVGAWVLALALALVRGYRLLLSPWLGSSCRFEPTCSRYALEALERHGPWRGVALSGWRVLRCHPWCQGGLDPVPAVHPDVHPDAHPDLRPAEAPRAAQGLFTSLPATTAASPETRETSR
jgi:uncharacterized protein